MMEAWGSRCAFFYFVMPWLLQSLDGITSLAIALRFMPTDVYKHTFHQPFVHAHRHNLHQVEHRTSRGDSLELSFDRTCRIYPDESRPATLMIPVHETRLGL